MASKPRGVLLVEGYNDEEVVKQFCNRHQLDNRSLFKIERMGGFDRLAAELRIWPREPTVTSVGAIFDADTKPDDRWSAAREALRHCGYTALPTRAPQGGLVLAGQAALPRVGLWMMPDNSSRGMLEDFLQSLVTEGDALLPRARQAVEAIPSDERRFKHSYETKAVVHTWLAWQEEPGTPLGLAVTRNYLDAQQPAAIRFRDWLLGVFVDGTATATALQETPS